MQVKEQTLVGRMRELAIDHEKHEQGGGASVLLNEGADEIDRLRECLLWLQQRHHGGLIRVKIDQALAPPDA
jgi:hypothetical protein